MKSDDWWCWASIRAAVKETVKLQEEAHKKQLEVEMSKEKVKKSHFKMVVVEQDEVKVRKKIIAAKERRRDEEKENFQKTQQDDRRDQ